MTEKKLEELWPDFLNDLEKIKQGNSKEWGYNNLYCRNFVNKAISMEYLFNESHIKNLFLSLLELEDKGYSNMTIIKCFIALKKRFHDRLFMDQLRDKLKKIIVDYQGISCVFANQMTKMKFRGLMTILAECSEQI